MPTIHFAGLASGIDSDAVIKALTDARAAQGAPIQAKIDSNDKESKAFGEFSTKLLALSDALTPLQTLAGGALSKIGTSSNSDAVGVVASNAAASSTATVDIKQIAKAANLSFDDRFTKSDQPLAPDLAESGSIDFTVGTGDGAQKFSVTVTNQTTLSQLASSINAAANGKVQASVVNLGTDSAPQYALLVNGLEVGTGKGTLTATASDTLKGAGLFASQNLDQAQDAILNVSGIGQVTRSTNQISDLIPGVTLQLKQEKTGPTQISIGNDSDKTAAAIQTFVDAFNDVVKYSSDNSKITRVENGTTVNNIFGSLAKSSVDNNAVSQLKEALAGSFSRIDSTEIRGFPDLGVTTQRDGTLKFDKTTFQAAVAKDPTATGQILNSFADQVSTTNGIIANYTRFQGQIELAVKADTDQNQSLNDQLDQLQRNIDSYTEQLRKTFANLESTIGGLNSVSSALAGLSSK